MQDKGKPRYGREIAGDFGRSLVAPFNGSWREWFGRWIWWMQALEFGVLALACWVVWDLTGSAVATGVAFFGVLTTAVLVDLEARATERHAERRRLTDALGVDLDVPVQAFPDGHVLAYELHFAPGAELGDPDQPFILLGATPADRWDLVDAAWTFAVKGVAEGGGVMVVIDHAGFPALAQLGPLWRELAGGTIADLVTLEQRLVQIGARDVTDRRPRPVGARVAL